MNKSEAINELAAALCVAQSQIRGAVKDSANPFFKSKYADLESCWDAVRDPLFKNGLSVIQTMGFDADGRSYVETTLAHKSGQWISGQLLLNALKPDPQAQGSAITYARRYALAAIVGLVQVDDDAEAAHGRGQEHALSSVTNVKRSPAPAPAHEPEPQRQDYTPGYCCERPMMVSKYNERELYCPKCKRKEKRAA